MVSIRIIEKILGIYNAIGVVFKDNQYFEGQPNNLSV